jgi:hypothetical protein
MLHVNDTFMKFTFHAFCVYRSFMSRDNILGIRAKYSVPSEILLISHPRPKLEDLPLSAACIVLVKSLQRHIHNPKTRQSFVRDKRKLFLQEVIFGPVLPVP